MRYHEIAEEEPSSPAKRKKTQAQKLKVYADIVDKCKPYLQEIHWNVAEVVMYRGLLNSKGFEARGMDAGIKQARLSSRRPRDSSQEVHDDMNVFFDKNYGHPYRDGVFVSGRRSEAGSYGEAYAIFPVGEYDYIWHPDVTDLLTSTGAPITITAQGYWSKFAKANGASNDYEIDQFIKASSPTALLAWIIEQKGPYMTDNMPRALHGGGEIMMWMKEYYYLPVGEKSQLMKYIIKSGAANVSNR